VDLAQEALNRALAADPRYADAHYLLGTTMGANGRIEDAARCYREALEIDPGHAKAEEFLMRTEALISSRSHYVAAMKLIYTDDRQPDWLNLAVRELLHSVAIFKDSPAVSEFAGLATMIIESGSIKSPGNPIERGDPFWLKAITRAESAFDRKSWPEAAAAYNESIEFSSRHAFVRHALGLIYFALGDHQSGISAWQKAFELDPDHDFSSIWRL
jgi:tetratricopeptide (TPR) repeat protein